MTAALLTFGGAYGNLAALDALLRWAQRRGLGAADIVFTGDWAAYCADGAAVTARAREELAGARMVRGNCERALAEDAEDCGCGFAPGSACAVLSDAWFRHARETIDLDARKWMGSLPPRLDFVFGGRRIAITHAGAEADNEFIFPSTAKADKLRHLQALDAEGVICGHSGIPFTETVGDNLLWHNSGALGMPANDGTPRAWFSLWEESGSGIRIQHIPLEYDHKSSQEAMRLAGLPAGYRECLASGIWPSDSVLPPEEKSRQGRALEMGEFVWD